MSTATAGAPPIAADEQASCEYLETLFGTADAGSLSIVEFPNPDDVRVSWFPIADRCRAAQFIAQAANQHRTPYLGMGLRYTPLPNNQRGGKEHVCGAPGIWGDVDYRDPLAHVREDLPPDADAALKIIREATPQPPTLIVDSGWGYYPQLLFREFWHFDGAEERERFALLLRRYDHALRTKADGAHVDPAKDPARVLKPAGAINWKVDGKPRLVRILHDGGPRYTADELEEILPELPVGENQSQYYGGSLGSLLPEELEEIVAILKPWHRDGARHHSGVYVAGYCARAGFEQADTAEIVRRISSHDLNPGDRQKAVGDTYSRLRDGKPVSGYYGLRDTVGLDDDSLERLERLREQFQERTQPRIHTSHRNKKDQAAAGDSARTLPTIDIADQDLERSSKACWDALKAANTPPFLFVHGNLPTRINRDEKTGAPIPQPLDVSRLRNHLARAATFVRTTAKETVTSARPAEAVIKDMLAYPVIPLPQLEAIREVPIFAPDGTLSTKPGYHDASHTYYAPSHGFTLPSIPERPTEEDVAAARSLIESELFGDFPFTSAADRGHAIAMLLLLFARNLIDGPTPEHLIEKPSPGTGATLMVDAIAMVATGRPAAAMTEGRDEDDMRKRLTAVLLTSPVLVFFDNLRRPLDYSCLAAVITETRWKDRILGTSSVTEIPVNCVWCATGNNPVLSSEMTRRTVSIRLDAKHAQPWLRSGFRQPNLRAWVKTHRAELVAACLTLVRAWITKGKPAPRNPVIIGMFEEWSLIMGGILDCAGITGFLENRQDFYSRSDKEGDAIRGFLTAWWEAHGPSKVKVSTLFTIATAPDSTIDISAKSEQGQRVRLGALVAAIEGRHYQLEARLTVRVVRTGEKEKGAVLWQIDPGESWSKNESNEQDSPQDSPHENPHNDAENGPSGESRESFSHTQRVVDEKEEEKTYTGPAEKDSPDSPGSDQSNDANAEQQAFFGFAECRACGGIVDAGNAYCADCDPRWN